MPQAMERLLASPKTTAVLPAKSIMLAFVLHDPYSGVPDQPFSRISAPISATQIDQPNLAHRSSQKARAQPLEFLHRVGRKKAEDRIIRGGPSAARRGRGREA